MKINWSRKGETKYLSVYWFVILFLVAAAVVYMVAVFYGKPYDVREVEGEFLINKIADCVSDGGMLKKDVFENSFSEEFLNFCHITLKSEDEFGWENDQIFLSIKVYNFDEVSQDLIGEERVSVEEGNVNAKNSCSFQNAVCNEKIFYSIYEGEERQEQYIVKIFAAIGKREKNG